MAHPKHQAVRVRYGSCCGYCGTSETDTGGELTVDHFEPVSAGGDDSDENLVYACFRCNLYKGFLLPQATDRTQEERLLHPLRDDMAEHIQENVVTGRLEGRTVTGAFHIASLRLNRAELIEQRLRKQVKLLDDTRYAQVMAENAILREKIAQYKTALQSLRRRRRRNPPKNRGG